MNNGPILHYWSNDYPKKAFNEWNANAISPNGKLICNICQYTVQKLLCKVALRVQIKAFTVIH